MLVAVRSAGDQYASGPSSLLDQSKARIRLPISPPPKGKATINASGEKSVVGSFIGRTRYHDPAGADIITALIAASEAQALPRHRATDSMPVSVQLPNDPRGREECKDHLLGSIGGFRWCSSQRPYSSPADHSHQAPGRITSREVPLKRPQVRDFRHRIRTFDGMARPVLGQANLVGNKADHHLRH
jgi:hypothetical protein